MNSICHLIYIPLRDVGIDLRDDEWFQERIEVFKNYTLRSLQNQTNQNFVIWISVRPEDEFNLLVADLANYMQDHGVRYVMTFDGLMYYDDKFAPGFMNKVRNMGRIVRACWRIRSFNDFIPSVKMIFKDKNATLKERLGKSLAVLRPYFEGVDWVYMTRIDSDDMFHKEAVALIQSVDPFCGALVCGNGLIYNTTSNLLAEWQPPTNPPFHTIIFPENTWKTPNHVFFDADRHIWYYRNFHSHEDVVKIFETIQLPDYVYCVTTHNPINHISTIWDHPFRKHLVDVDLIQNYVGNNR